jgi:hypothetical protein
MSDNTQNDFDTAEEQLDRAIQIYMTKDEQQYGLADSLILYAKEIAQKHFPPAVHTDQK